MNVFERVIYDGSSEEIKLICKYLEAATLDGVTANTFYELEDAVQGLYVKYSAENVNDIEE